MSGGLQQLVAFGAQDVYLTGNPEITLFKSIYRRHTNFSCEAVPQVHNGTADFDKTITVNIARQGDLINKMYLQVTVNQLSVNLTSGQTFEENNVNIAWVRRLGFAMIDYVEVEIGGQRIDKQYGTWLDLWYELTHCTNQEYGYRKMIGDVDEMIALEQPDESTGVAKHEYTMFIPLQFWFCRHDGQSLPLIALQYHELKLHVKFNKADKLLVWTGTNTLANAKASIKDVTLYVDYIYLDSEERHRFSRVAHEYLIEQVQFTGSESINSTSSTIQQRFKLNYNHPTKELVWAAKLGAFNGSGITSGTNSKSKFLCYSSDDDKWNVALEYAAFNIVNSMIQVTSVAALPGNTIGSNENQQYAITNFSADNTNPTLDGNGHILFGYHDLAAGRQVTYAAANLDFELYVLFQDQQGNIIQDNTAALGGAVGGNGAPIVGSHQIPVIRINPSPLVRSGINIASSIKIVDLVVEITLGGNAYDEYYLVEKKTDQLSVIRHELTLDDVSIPIDQWTDTRMAVDKRFDVGVVQHHNYGLRLDGKGNPISKAKLQFNSNDRFSEREGTYFNTVQPYQAHTRIPSDGINVYSFALKPEKYQPTGTANLSRIDSVVLQITFEDELRHDKSDKPQLDIATNTQFYVFAFSFNVLRIVSGMGGLAYSN